MYRVYDNLRKKWVKENIFMSPDGNLYILKENNKFIFNNVRPTLLSDDDRYICHKSIELYDKEDTLVYEGDYIKAKVSEDKEDKTVIGIVAYAHELSSYVILCVNSDEFYTLGSEVTEYIKVIGNVFDGYKGSKDGSNKSL